MTQTQQSVPLPHSSGTKKNPADCPCNTKRQHKKNIRKNTPPNTLLYNTSRDHTVVGCQLPSLTATPPFLLFSTIAPPHQHPNHHCCCHGHAAVVIGGANEGGDPVMGVTMGDAITGEGIIPPPVAPPSAGGATMPFRLLCMICSALSNARAAASLSVACCDPCVGCVYLDI